MILVNVKFRCQWIQENYVSRLQISLVDVLHMMAIRVFQNATKLAILALLPALYSHFLAHRKCEIRCHWIPEIMSQKLQTSLV